MHQVLGVVIFSSLLFIGVKDLIPVMIRFCISATTAQYIRIFEISGLLAGSGQVAEDHTTSYDRAGKSGNTSTESKAKSLPKADWIRAIVPPPPPLVVSSNALPSPHDRLRDLPRTNARGKAKSANIEKSMKTTPNAGQSKAQDPNRHET